MKELKRLLSFTRRAIDDYQMIEEGERIAVGVSGGKDSLSLLVAMAELRRFYPKKFDLVAITVDMGFPNTDFSPIAAFSENLGVPFHRAETDIAKIIFDIRKEPNPCSLCSKMRRGVLHSKAQELGCRRVALGHHFDDV
ncbi:MAG: tRNA 2-thiocytidine(32) synthetase TtcA, partial [Clostridia bacterium]|nr:tRNA 2-thiocytidine(32) synthetase TtcA [Clostridia bacterium]